MRRQTQGPDDIDVLKAEHVLATVYNGQRRFAQAETLLERVVAVSARTRGDDDAETLRFQYELGTIYLLDSKPVAARPHALRAAEGRRRTLGPDHRDTIVALIMAAAVHEALKEFPQGIGAATQAYEQSRRAHGPNDTMTLNASTVLQRIKLGAAVTATTGPDRAARSEFLDSAVRTLETAKASTLPELISLAGSRATFAYNQGRPQDAEAPLLEALAAASRAGQEELTLTAILAGIYAVQRKYADAETTVGRVLSKPETWKTLDANALPFALRSLGGGYRNEGRFADAERHFRVLVDLSLENPGETVNQTRIDLLLLADTYSSLERYADAEQWFAKLLESNRRTKGSEQMTSVVSAALGWVRLKRARYADAEGMLREVSATLVRTSPELWERFNVGSMLGASLAAQGRFSDAEPLLIAGYEGMATRKPGANPNFRSRFTQREAGEAILQLYEAGGNTAKRAEWTARLAK